MNKKHLSRRTLTPIVKTMSIYVVAATLARNATASAIIAVVLMARELGADGAGVGALTACLTLPHLLGPIYGRWLDGARDPRRLLAAMALLFSLSFQVAIQGFLQHQLAIVTLALLICGMGSSFLMGGLSSQITQLTANHKKVRRKAQSWDTVTYALGFAIGPLLLGVLTSHYSLHTAAAIVMALPAIAALVLMALPNQQNQDNSTASPVLSMGQILTLLQQSGSLKRTALMTSGAAFSVAALPVLAVYLAEFWQRSPSTGALLVTAYGIGNLCGALWLIAKPLQQDALYLLSRVGSALLLSIAAIVVSQTALLGFAAFALVGFCNALFFAVTLAARSDYSPPQGAAQIYMWVAAAKIGATSVGTFVAGVLVDQYLWLPIAAATLILSQCLFACFYYKRPINE